MQIIIISLLVFLLGLAMMVYGYRIFLVLLPVFGFFAGFWLGADITSLFLGTGFLGSIAGWVAGFVLGLIFALFSYMFFTFAIGVQVMIITYSIIAGILGAFFGPGIFSALIGAAVALVVLILIFAFNLQRYVVIVITSIVGSNAVLLSALLLFGHVTLDSLQARGTSIIPIVRDSWLWLLVWLVLAGVGVWSQVRANRTYEFLPETYMEGWG